MHLKLAHQYPLEQNGSRFHDWHGTCGWHFHCAASMPAYQRDIRKKMRSARRALTVRQQLHAADQLTQLIVRHPLFLRAHRIAFYLPNDGEIDPTAALHEALSQGKHCYLPVLYRGGVNRLLFGKTTANSRFILNRFGIPEPDILDEGWCYSNQLDLVLTPLVAFDESGNRIGMGGGYYDSSLQHLRRNPNWQRPCVIGVAHEFQRIEQIGRNAWDIPLRAAITDKQSYQFNSGD